MVAGPRNRPPYGHAANEKLNSVVRVVRTGPPNRTVVGIGTSSSALPDRGHREFVSASQVSLSRHKDFRLSCPVPTRRSRLPIATIVLTSFQRAKGATPEALIVAICRLAKLLHYSF